MIEHKKGTSSSDILLEVLQAPKIIGEWENKIVREELQTLELTCNTVQGNPIPTIRWFKNDYPLGRVYQIQFRKAKIVQKMFKK